MFFEGSEKKAEIIIDGTQLSLFNDYSDDFWSTMVQHSDGQILSKMTNAHCKAFILSESSLFIWADRLLVLTCGTTRLVRAVEFFLQHTLPHFIMNLNYQRKNEYLAQQQFSHFIDDVKQLNHYGQGRSYRFGEFSGHHRYVYHLDNHYQSVVTDKTYELLMYQISKSASQRLTKPTITKQQIREFLCSSLIPKGFLIDDHLFEPFGYSLNAINAQQYITIHVTPQEQSSYISIQANFDLFDQIPHILDILAPRAFDIVCFNEFAFASKLNQLFANLSTENLSTKHPYQGHRYVCKDLVRQQLDNGLYVCFTNYISPSDHISPCVHFSPLVHHDNINVTLDLPNRPQK